MPKRLALLCYISIAICTCALGAGRPLTITAPKWHVGDSWVVLHSSLDRHLASFLPYKELYKVTGFQNVSGYKCYVLRQVHLRGCPLELLRYDAYGYYRTTDMALLRVQVFENAGNGAPRSLCDKYDWLPNPQESSWQHIRIIVNPLRLPPFPIVAGTERAIGVKSRSAVADKPWTLKRDANGMLQFDHKPHKPTGKIRYVTSWVAASAEQTTVTMHGNRRVCAVKVKFSFTTDTELDGKVTHADDIYMEQTWVPGMPWWTSAECGAVRSTLVIRPVWLTPVEVAGGVCCVIGLVAFRRRIRRS